MYEFCITIGGVRHCFVIPKLVEIVHRPPPNNYPPFEVALAVKQLAQLAPASDFTRRLDEVAENFIQQVRKGLPAGVELVSTAGATR